MARMALPGPNHEDCATALRRVTFPSAINDAATTPRSPIASDHIKSPDHMWLGAPKGVAPLMVVRLAGVTHAAPPERPLAGHFPKMVAGSVSAGVWTDSGQDKTESWHQEKTKGEFYENESKTLCLGSGNCRFH